MGEMRVVAESISPAVPLVFFGAIGLGLVGLVFVRIAVARRRREEDAGDGDARAGGRGRSVGFAFGAVAALIGAGLILMFATTRGGVPQFMYIAAALPLIAGIRIMQICRRRKAG
jgi:hypothetical protein